MTSDVDILLSTTQTKKDIDMVHYSDVTTLSQFLKSPAPRLLFQLFVKLTTKKTLKHRITGFLQGNPPETGLVCRQTIS